MSIRWTLHQIGGSGRKYPLISLPLHSSKFGDVSLFPQRLCWRFGNDHDGFGKTDKKSLVDRDPCQSDIGGIGHMMKNTYSMYWKAVSKILYGKEISFQKLEENSPQFTGTECREIARKFEVVLAAIGGSAR